MNAPDSDFQKRFFYLVNDQMFGPLELADLAAELRLGQITQETLVRQQGETSWAVFRERPEFILATEIPVEVIARHLEAKERAAAAAPSSTSWLTSGVMITAISFFMGAFALFWIMSVMNSAEKLPTPLASAGPTPVPWIKTEENGFSVESPVRLIRIPVSPEEFGYSGMAFGAIFFVELRSLPGANYTDEQYEFELSKFESHLLESMHVQVISSHNITVNGHPGHDVLFSKNHDDTKIPGGARFLAGNENLAAAWIYCTKANSEGIIDRFLNSFQLQ